MTTLGGNNQSLFLPLFSVSIACKAGTWTWYLVPGLNSEIQTEQQMVDAGLELGKPSGTLSAAKSLETLSPDTCLGV